MSFTREIPKKNQIIRYFEIFNFGGGRDPRATGNSKSIVKGYPTIMNSNDNNTKLNVKFEKLCRSCHAK